MDSKKSDVKWTKDQERVINIRNCNVLVSAAAGSGKTAVLVERIIKKVLSGVNIDRLLIVTFTKAAASEMKERILQALEKEIEKAPNNKHLKKQMLLIHNANITTIDSFCLNVVKNYFNEIDLNPSFRIADDSEIKLIKKDVIEKVLEKHYQEANSDFLEFIESYADSKSDKNIEDIIMSVYETSTSYPWPLEWLESCRDNFNITDKKELEECDWVKKLIEHINNIAIDLKASIEYAISICSKYDEFNKVLDLLMTDVTIYDQLIVAKTYEDMYKVCDSISYKRYNAPRKSSVPSNDKELIKDIRDNCKKSVENIKKKYFYQDVDNMLYEIKACKKTMNVLVDLAIDFYNELAKEKEDRNVYYFSDIESFALKILINNEDGKKVESSVADILSNYYDEILIDEYQDSNNLQETILKAVSKERFGKNNIFMVGDVKQSIYKFRMARPELFMEKFSTYSKEDNDIAVRIDLMKNFRSRDIVLKGINRIFEKIMTKKLGNIEYDKYAALYTGRAYPTDDKNYSDSCELLLFNQNGLELAGDNKDDEQLVEYTKKEIEAKIIVKRIKELVDSKNGLMVVDKDSDGNEIKRRATYKDIVILFRSVTSFAESFIDVFASEKIPMYIESTTGYFSTIEVRTALNMLRIVDNPRQDIALAGVLSSSIGGFTNNELAHIRLHSSMDIELYDALKNYLKDGDDELVRAKIDRFLIMLNRFRDMVAFLDVHELLQIILEETGYLNFVYAMTDGKKRRMNLDMLIEHAINFEGASYKGLFNFIRSIEQMEKYDIDFGEAKTLGGDDNFVRIMTIHKSKGLEFPIVFVAGLGQDLNLGSVRDKILVHQDFGLAPTYVDIKHRIKSKTLLKTVITSESNKDYIGEELRVLYVALTRAKEKLILTASSKDVVKDLENYAKKASLVKKQFSYEQLCSTKRYIDLILPAIIQDKGFKKVLDEYGINVHNNSEECLWKASVRTIEDISINDVDSLSTKELIKQEIYSLDSTKIYDKNAYEFLQRAKTHTYKYQDDIQRKIKYTVSELKSMGQLEHDDIELLEDEDRIISKKEMLVSTDGKEVEIDEYIPRFISDKKDEYIASNKIGTATHKIMQLINLEAISSINDVKMQVSDMILKGHIDEKVAKFVSMKKIYNFSKSTIAKRIINAQKSKKAHKEQQFVLGIDDDIDGLVLVQGMIDIYIEEDDGIVLIDYKTDRVNDRSVLIQRYTKQLDYYSKAIEQLTNKKVKEKIIYSFSMEKELLL